MFFLFGLAEVKGPHTKFHVTPLDACSDPDCLWRSMPVSVTKEEPLQIIYAQVYEQMGITGAKWCNFIVYTSK